LLPLVDAIPPIRGVRGRPLQKPKVIYADRGYDSEAHRQKLRERGIKPVIAKRRTEHGSGLGQFRWVVERTRVASQLPSSSHSLRTSRRHSRSISQTRLLSRLLEHPQMDGVAFLNPSLRAPDSLRWDLHPQDERTKKRVLPFPARLVQNFRYTTIGLTDFLLST
jgi:hypothetical protein